MQLYDTTGDDRWMVHAATPLSFNFLCLPCRLPSFFILLYLLVYSFPFFVALAALLGS
jgi:hypothetical protein